MEPAQTTLIEFLIGAITTDPTALSILLTVVGLLTCLVAFVFDKSQSLLEGAVWVGAAIVVASIGGIVWAVVLGGTPRAAPFLLTLGVLYLLGKTVRYSENSNAAGIFLDVDGAITRLAGKPLKGANSRSEFLAARQNGSLSIKPDWRPYAVYLRPFTADNYSGTASRSLNVEEINIKNGVTKQFGLPLMSIGIDGKFMDAAARIRVDDGRDWEDVALTLLLGAEFIVLWPANSAGTRQEMDWCATHFRDRTIFFQPGGSDLTYQKQVDLVSATVEAGQLLKSAGMDVPILYDKSIFWANTPEAKLVMSTNLPDVVATLGIEVRVRA